MGAHYPSKETHFTIASYHCPELSLLVWHWEQRPPGDTENKAGFSRLNGYKENNLAFSLF